MTTQDRIYDYFKRNPRLHVLFVFDPMGNLEAELHGLDWQDGYRYELFDGGWFSAKYYIENDWKDERVILLFQQMQSPLGNQEWMQQFPLMDVLVANMDYKVDSYAAFIQQYNISGEMAAYVQRHILELQQQRVAKILAPYYNENLTIDVANRGLLAAYAGLERLQDWENLIIRLILLDASGRIADVVKGLARNNDVLSALNSELQNIFGAEFEINSTSGKMMKVAESLKYNSITQLLAVDKLRDDYHRYKITNALSLQRLNSLMENALQSRHSSEFTDAIEKLAAGVRETEILKCYGYDAEYYRMTPALTIPIIVDALRNVTSDVDAITERVRIVSQKMWWSDELRPMLRFAVCQVNYYSGKKAFGTRKLNTPQQYIERYTSEFFLVDRAYRHMLESFSEIDPTMQGYEEFQKAKRIVDMDYSNLCNELNMEWLKCVKDSGMKLNAIPNVLPQQRFFTEYRSNDGVKQVVIISDAMRYEVAQELLENLAMEKHYAEMKYMLSMLPSETEFCKDALMPYNTLKLVNTEMEVDGKMLNTIDQRRTHLSQNVPDADCVNYEAVMGANTNTNRELFKKPLVFVYHNTIDEAGHHSTSVIDACRQSVKQIAKLVKSLHASYNVANVIITADHGFLYNDIQFEDKDKHSVTEDCIEKKTRYYLTKSDASVTGIAKFKLSDVSAMQEDVYVAVPTGTNRLAAAGGYQFAHGGASLQEMIVPVIVSKGKKENTKGKVNLLLMDHDLKMVSSRTKLRLLQAEAVSMDVQERTVKCALYSGDEPVTAEKIITLNSTDVDNVNNRINEVELTLNKSTSASVLQLRIYDVDDELNPLIKENVRNNTLIEQDF